MVLSDEGVDWTVIGVNLCLFSLVSIINYVVTTVLWPHRHGFYTDDQSIRWPYVAAHINENFSIIAVSVCSKILFSTLEYLTARPYKLKKRRLFRERYMAEWSWQSSIINIRCIYTLFATVLVVNVAKVTLGRLSPNFIEVCQPPSQFLNTTHGYLKEYTCENTNRLEVFASMSSFPNIHATVLLYGVTMFSIYLSHRFNCRFSFLLPTINLALLTVAGVVILKCVRDHWAHPSDVIAGAILGSSIAFLMFKYQIIQLPDYSKMEEEAKEEINGNCETGQSTVTATPL